MFGCAYYGQMVYGGGEARYGVQGSATIQANVQYNVVLKVAQVSSAILRIDLT